jgi:hypothetical protein
MITFKESNYSLSLFLNKNFKGCQIKKNGEKLYSLPKNSEVNVRLSQNQRFKFLPVNFRYHRTSV